ncbi:NAD-dependent succinate-semialdehyde dehydrogenase [Deinococcus sp. 12RED42]|uniref:NAD-dependent succinate-semialdehyde dehydrogenase n=1 Tax=Deinococcus sp. 12RED42 TaxID=2745872 RepID=UPI001E4702AC|nr:NAD-dependent succinate-semialdehyde dehydrogenase [Deinococcus sp. 12RED42]MCD0167039.1 NAD-dependent succinate-semialdehyde dehydrogenase [Deinococcus sp. 12RED42]
MQSVNPATGETFATYEDHTTEQVQAAVAAAHAAYGTYRRTSFEQRSEWMNAAADILERRVDELALLATREMGKTLEAARQEVLKCASACRYYAEHAGAFLASEPVKTEADEAFVTYQPLGVVLAVMPWNFPYWQAFRFIAPTLMAGNTGLLKHASNVPGCALAIEDVLREAGFPAGVFTTLLIGSRDVEAVLKDPRVTAVSLTGSEGAGRAVSATAGGELKPAVMELGGSDPFIVMPSADIELAAKTAVTARTINNGQSCIAAKRFIVHADVYDAFTDAFVAGLSALKVGNPELEGTDVGPLATPQIREDIHAQVQDAVRRGARVRTGGQVPDGAGNYYPVTALDGLTPDMDVWTQETFGPVALIFRVDSLDGAVELANSTSFGLGSSAWTNDPAERGRFIADLEAGSVFINSMVASDPRLPFGGVKNSGFGRELGRHGILQFVNVKSVSIGAPEGAHHSTIE